MEAAAALHYGEWLIPSTSKAGFADQEATGRAMAETAAYAAPVYGYVSVSILGKIAEILRIAKDAAYYTQTALKMKDAIQSCLIGPEGEAPAAYMGAYVLFLYFELVPEKWKKKYEAELLRMIRENGGSLPGSLRTKKRNRSSCSRMRRISGKDYRRGFYSCKEEKRIS